MPTPSPEAFTGRPAFRDPRELSPYHRNPRHGDVGAIAASLRASGQYRPIVVNVGSLTGRAFEVLAGNHTLFAVRELGWPGIATWEIDVDNETAARIVAADNRTADLGGYHDQVLAELLSELDANAGLDGSGYTSADLADLLKAVSDAGPIPPEEFPEIDEETIETEHACPRCGYRWSGASS